MFVQAKCDLCGNVRMLSESGGVVCCAECHIKAGRVGVTAVCAGCNFLRHCYRVNNQMFCKECKSKLASGRSPEPVESTTDSQPVPEPVQLSAPIPVPLEGREGVLKIGDTKVKVESWKINPQAESSDPPVIIDLPPPLFTLFLFGYGIQLDWALEFPWIKVSFRWIDT